MTRFNKFAPPKVSVNLKFTKSVQILAAGGITANIIFTPTNAFDIDPLFASTAMPGFAEWAALYRYYRVLSSSIQADFMNSDPIPGTVAIVPVNFSPGANHTATTTIQLLGQPDARCKPLGAITGNGITTLRHRASTAKFAGARFTGSTDEYSAPVALTSGPVNNWHWDLIWYPANLMTAGVLCHLTLKVQVVFYELNAPSI
jgi:hypothetical protein